MESNYVLANTNGRLHDASEASLSPLDRGFLYGDAVYEVWRTYEGTLFAFDEHWARLQVSAAALHIALPFGRETLLAEIQKTAAAFVEKTGHVGALYVRLQVSRGGGVIGLDVKLADKPSYVLLVQKLALYPAEKLKSGLTLSVAQALRRNAVDALNPAWKTGNYLNNLLCLREALARGADEVLMLNHQGAITEAAVSNVFFVRKNAIVSPPASSGILLGVTRRILLETIAPRLGVTVTEENINAADLHYFDGCFLTSTTKDVTPVSSIDATRYALDDSCLVWKLKAAFQNYASDYAVSHPELRLAKLN